MVNTKTAERRTLHFDNFEQAIADAERCVAAEHAGRLKRTGNWTTGQVLAHLSFWIEGGFDGFDVKPPLVIRLIGPLMKNMVINKPGRPGFRLPKVPGGTYGADDMPADAALERYRKAARRLEAECPAKPNPAFGKLTHDEWKKLHLRHAELHVSFLHPQ